MSDPSGFGERLAELVARRRSALVAGFDPAAESLPPELASAAARGVAEAPDEEAALAAAGEIVARWGEELVEAVAPFCVAVKLQLAAFEQFGAAGLAAARRVARRAQEHGLLVIADGKRGDIGSTMRWYGAALFGPVTLPGGRTAPGLGADAATINVYAGDDTLEALAPWLASGRGVFVVVHTSNPSAERFQHLPLRDGRLLADEVAVATEQWSASRARPGSYGPVGAVVGATYPQVLKRLRNLMPRVWMLLPGVGAQGGEIAHLLPAFDGSGLGALATASRHIMAAWQRYPGEDWRKASALAAAALRDELERVRMGRGV